MKIFNVQCYEYLYTVQPAQFQLHMEWLQLTIIMSIRTITPNKLNTDLVQDIAISKAITL